MALQDVQPCCGTSESLAQLCCASKVKLIETLMRGTWSVQQTHGFLSNCKPAKRASSTVGCHSAA